MEETQDQDVSLRIQTDLQEEEVGHNTHQIEEDDLDTVHVGNQKEDLPIDFGGIQKEAYLQSLARMSTKVKFLTNWTRGELEQFEASLQQLHSRGANPQVIDLIDESLHKSLLTMLREEGHLVNGTFQAAYANMRGDTLSYIQQKAPKPSTR